MPGNDRGGVPPGADDGRDAVKIPGVFERYIKNQLTVATAQAQRKFEEEVCGDLENWKPLGILNYDTRPIIVNGPSPHRLRAERPARIARAVDHLRETETVTEDRNWFKWAKVENKTAGRVDAEVYIYDEIGYWGVTSADFIDTLAEYAADATHILVRINSPGGEVFDGIAIGNALREHKAHVTVRVDSLAASAASFIAAMAGDEVVMGAYSQMMIHDASGLAIGNAKDMREMADLLDRLSDNIAAMYAGKAGGSKSSWRDLMRAETWMNGEEAVNLGLADRALDPEDDPSGDAAKEAADRFDMSNFAYPGREKAPPPQAVATDVPPEPEVVAPTFSTEEFRALMERAASTATPDPDIIRAGITLVANDQPAPTSTPKEDVSPAPAGPGPIDPDTFYNAIRKALLDA